MATLVSTPDLAANAESVVLAQLPQGNYNLTIGADRGTQGPYELQVYLVGDATGDRKVDAADNAAVRAAAGSVKGQAKYNPLADFNLDGTVATADLSFEAIGGTDNTPLNPLTFSAAFSTAPITTLGDGSLLFNSHSVTITGQTLAGITVTANDAAHDSAVAGPAGTFTLPVTLGEGLNTLTVSAADSFGQQQSVVLNATSDTTPPATPTLDLDPASDTAPVGDHATTLATVTLDGTTEAGAAVALIAGGSQIGTATADAGGTFQFSNVSLTLGDNSFTVTATDQAHNSSSKTVTITRNSTAVAPSLSASLSNDTGASAHDGITSDATIRGSVTASAAIASFEAGFDLTPVAGFADILPAIQTGGTFVLDSAAVTSINGGVALPDGGHTLHLVATDANGLSASVDVTFTLETIATVPVFALDGASQGSTDHKTTLGTVGFSGSADPGAQIALSTGAVTTAASNGHFAFGGISLTGGANLFFATATDLAGNVASGNQIIFQISATQSGGQVAAGLGQPGAGRHSDRCVDTGICQPGDGDDVGGDV